MASSSEGGSLRPVMMSAWTRVPMSTWTTYPSRLSLATTTRVGPHPAAMGLPFDQVVRQQRFTRDHPGGRSTPRTGPGVSSRKRATARLATSSLHCP
jgi:hypothetical protein